MNTYHFTILIRHATHNSELEDALFEAGCDDALLFSTNGAVCLEFDREAPDAQTAVQSAFTQIQQAGFHDLVLQETGYATLGEIAQRSGLSRAALSQYALGKRGEHFPAPMYITGKSALYSWKEAAQWLYQNGKLPQTSAEIAALNIQAG
ncbi:XRE family transcriptional regulator [Kingella negevensis]|uniref:helix-turn-helix transcriptional regulator n=1 Tax=Kingella negevensis TaxID=1522312 RepID=UPI0025437DD3|nr:XRE family transcriptional regulator [Kingella negevensis]WII92449.1 XRE family transcriptional regulator [Kingella negevensis]